MSTEFTQAPWTVFEDTTKVRSEPAPRAAELRTLSLGSEVHGTQIHVCPENDEEWLEIADGFVSLTALLRVHPANRVSGNLPIGQEIVDRWWGMPLQYEPDDLVEPPAELTIQDGKAYLLRREACEAAEAMLRAAETDGVVIRIISAYRSGAYQKELFRRAVSRGGAGQRYSARPGHSEHQLGTVVDLTDPAQQLNFQYAFGESVQGRWLAANAARFHFRRSYTDHNTAETGYISEPWHWRYIGPSK